MSEEKKFRVIFFVALPGNDEAYGDCATCYLDLDFRPNVGDLFPWHVITLPDDSPPWRDNYDIEIDTNKRRAIEGLSGKGLLLIEKLLYGGNNVFYAYCLEIKADEGTRHDDGTRGNDGSLIYHYAEQAHSFHDRHNRTHGKR